MEIKILILINLLLYSIIVSQSFAYILFLRNVQLHMDAPEYIRFRHRTDANFQAKFKWIVYGTLASNVMILAMCNPGGQPGVFISAAIAMIALVADVVIALKGNIPINNQINSWRTDSYPADWAAHRQNWLNIFSWRQALNIAGFAALLCGIIF